MEAPGQLPSLPSPKSGAGPRPVKQYNTTHRNTEFIFMASPRFMRCSIKLFSFIMPESQGQMLGCGFGIYI